MPANSNDSTTARIEAWRPEYRADFERLNREWIEQYFAVEEEDQKVFRDPEGIVIRPGGQIFFVVDEEGVRGTCAVILHDADTWELAKMAVSPSARGRGYGDLLVEAAIAFARGTPAKTLMLQSNTRLSPALALYRKHGFRDAPLDAGTGYFRADIQLELPLVLSP